MTIEGYFDGTAVRPLEPVELKVNQRVFINVPAKNSDDESDEDRKIRQRNAINSLFGLLTKEEARLLDESIQQGIKLKEIDL